MYLGSRSAALMNEAIALDNQSAVVVQLYAGSRYYFPKMFGGDLKEAIRNYKKAIELFEKESRTDEWLYLDALAFLGKSYMRLGETEKAIITYKKALHIAPNFRWVKDSLLPKAVMSKS